MHPAKSLLLRENDLITRFLDLLKEEQSVLLSAAADALGPVVARKQPLIDELNRIENERTVLIGCAAGKTSRADMQHWLEQQPQPHAAELAVLWKTTLHIAQQAKALHLENQDLLNKHLARTEAALDILMQRQQSTAVYGSDGQTSCFSGSRIVDSA